METQPKNNEYDQQTISFLESTGTIFDIRYEYTGHYFLSDTEKRDIYTFTLKNSKGEYSAKFGDSLQNSARRLLRDPLAVRKSGKSDLQLVKDAGVYPKDKTFHGVAVAQRNAAKLWEKPTAYDVLACLTAYDPGMFEDFCNEYGYSEHPLSEYPKIQGIYAAVMAEYRSLRRMFTSDQLDQLAEIN